MDALGIKEKSRPMKDLVAKKEPPPTTINTEA
jgi:hypothetical protein